MVHAVHVDVDVDIAARANHSHHHHHHDHLRRRRRHRHRQWAADGELHFSLGWQVYQAKTRVVQEVFACPARCGKNCLNCPRLSLAMNELLAQLQGNNVIHY